ncbi:MAG TPA: hypothetical protein VFC21_11635 [Bryobacteraceae bacterium]|nr:hypothetical protein [Bryobacteraceae bacterium]
MRLLWVLLIPLALLGQKPDFSGIYEWPKALPGAEHGKGSATIFDRRNFAPFKPGGEAFLEPRTGDPRHDEPRDFCLPAGMVAGMLSANAVRLVQNGQFLAIAHEFQAMTRLIPLDGRKHREGLEPMFNGDPVGHWEGDTLVIETTNFKRWMLDDYFYTNPKEYRMHSDALRAVERIHRKDASTLSYRMTIDDPKIFTEPWSQDFEMKARPDWESMGIFEYVCEENNRCPGGKCGGQ